jgi:hypothetical protein
MEVIDSIGKLESIYGEAPERALVKERDTIIAEYARFIERSPFCMLATVGPEGVDVSPRGDPPGSFVRIADERTLLLPDRRGNNRVDSLRNIVRDPRCSLIFMIPGIGETVRVIGEADLVIDAGLLADFAMDGKPPRCIVRVAVRSVYFQCQKALVRSRLWDPASAAARGDVPTAGQMLQGVLPKAEFDGDDYDRSYPEHMARTIY